MSAAARIVAAVIGAPKALLILLVKGYRLFFSAWLGRGCLYLPTCSAYSLEALERHGAAAGSYLTARRLLRCRPWCCAGLDPVPEHPPAFFRWMARAGRGHGAQMHQPADRTAP